MSNMKKVGITLAADGQPEFIRSLKEINAELRESYSEMKLVESQFDKNTTKVEKMGKANITYKKDLDLQSEKVNRLRLDLDDLEGAENRNETAISNKRKQLNWAEKDLGDYEKRVEETTKKLENGTYAWEGFADKLGAAGEKTQDVGKKVSVVSGVVAGLGTVAVTAAVTLDNAFKEVIKATGATGEEAEELEQTFKNVFKEVPESAGEVADAMANLSTFTDATGEDLEELTILTLDYARVNNQDAGQSAIDLGKLMNALDQDISELPLTMDKLTFASQETGISVDALASNLIEAGPAFEELGFSTDDQIALFGQFEKAGAKPSELLSSMNQLLNNFAKDGATNAQEAFEMLSEEIKGAENEFDAGTIAAEYFGAKVGRNVAEDIRAGSFDVEDFAAEVANAGGTLEQTAEDTETFGDKINILKNKGTEMLSDFGGPIVTMLEDLMKSLEPVLEKLSEWATKFSEMDEGTQQMIVKIGLFIAVLGPVIIIIGKIMSAISAVMGFIAPLVGPIVAGVKLIALALNLPVAAVVAIGVAIAAFIILVVKYWDEIKEVFEIAWEWLKELGSKIGEWIGEKWEALKESFSNLWEWFGEKFDSIMEFIMGIIDPVVEWIQETFDTVKEWFSELWEKIGEGISNFVEKVVDFLKIPFDFIKNVFLVIVGLYAVVLETIWNALKKGVKKAQELIGKFKDKVSEIFDKIKEFIVNVIDKIKTGWQTGINWIRDKIITPLTEFFSGIFEGIKEKISTVIEGIKTAFQTGFNFVKDKIITPLTEFFSGVFEGIKNIIDGVITKIKTAFEKVGTAIKTVFSGIKTTVVNIFSSIGNIIKAPINAIIRGINGALRAMNKIKIPSWVPGIGGKGVNFNMITQLAKGGNLLSGQAIVAEAGPELLQMNGGRATVTPLSDGGGARKRDIIDYSAMGKEFSKALYGAKFKLDKDGFIKIVNDRLYEVL